MNKSDEEDLADYLRDQMKDREMEEDRERLERATPETTEHFRDNVWCKSDYGERRRLVQKDIDLMRSLELRLGLARSALFLIAGGMHDPKKMLDLTIKALEQTSKKHDEIP